MSEEESAEYEALYAKKQMTPCPLDDGYSDESGANMNESSYQYGPIAYFHGLGEDCKYTRHRGCKMLMYLNSSAYIKCVEIGTGE